MTRDRNDTKEIIGEVLKNISLILAPFAPYVSEYIYRNFSKESVHLSNWPKYDKKLIKQGRIEFAKELDAEGYMNCEGLQKEIEGELKEEE